MREFEVVLKFMKNIFVGLLIEGLLALIIGVLILIYPPLLNILVGILLIVGGLISLILAIKVNQYSKIKIKL